MVQTETRCGSAGLNWAARACAVPAAARVVPCACNLYLAQTVLRRQLLSRTLLGRPCVALLAFGLIMRLSGGACEAMTAVPAMPVAHMTDCDRVPAGPAKQSFSACAVPCVALPDAPEPAIKNLSFALADPQAGLTARLTGLARGPLPPPPRSA